MQQKTQPYQNSLNKAFETRVLFVTHGSGSSAWDSNLKINPSKAGAFNSHECNK